MGYYSQVSYAIEFPNEEHLKNFVATFRLVPELKEALDGTRVAGVTLFYDHDYTKWYGEFADVKAHKRILDEANDLGYATCFTRIGEEDGDIEKDYQDGEHEDYGNDIPNGYEFLEVERRVVKYFNDDNPITVDALLGLTEGETK